MRNGGRGSRRKNAVLRLICGLLASGLAHELRTIRSSVEQAGLIERVPPRRLRSLRSDGTLASESRLRMGGARLGERLLASSQYAVDRVGNPRVNPVDELSEAGRWIRAVSRGEAYEERHDRG